MRLNGRLLRVALLIAALVGIPAIARADEISPERRAQLERARVLVEKGIAALNDGRAEDAVDLLQQSREVVPGEAVPAYDHALALARAGQMDEALVAYKDALASAPPEVRAAVTARARHNLSGIELDLARSTLQMLKTPGALEQSIRAQPGPDGEPLTDAMAKTLAGQLRRKLIDDGLNAAKDAVAILRDTVREDPAARDAITNLILAQRARRGLTQALQDDQQSKQDDKGDQDDSDENKEDGDEGNEGDQGKPDDEGEDEEDANAGEDDEEQGEQDPSDNGESTESDEKSSESKQGEPRDVGKEEAERMLDRLLDAAAQKARKVEQMRAERLRRGAVEKDW